MFSVFLCFTLSVSHGVSCNKFHKKVNKGKKGYLVLPPIHIPYVTMGIAFCLYLSFYLRNMAFFRNLINYRSVSHGDSLVFVMAYTTKIYLFTEN